MRKIITRERVPLLLTYLTLIAISITMFVLARGFPGSRMGAAAPGFFPQVISVLLLVLCIFGLLELARSSPERVVIPPRVLAAMGLALGYIEAMHLIGYYPSTLLFAFLIMLISRERASWLRIALDALLITLGSYVFFEMLIDAYLPTGILFG